jgi:fatty-acid desaturase
LGLSLLCFVDYLIISSIILVFLTGWAAGFGVTGGAYRLWSHRSYKATPPLRIILLICYAVAGQVHLQLTVSVYCFVKFVEQTVRMGEEP